MARRIGDTPFQEILPDSIASAPVIKAAAASLDAALAPSLRGIPDVLLFARLAGADRAGMYGPLARLAELAGGLSALPEDALDSLAWQLHVDGYEAADGYEAKRRMVDRSLLLHRRKGTPWAVAEALRALGYAEVRIIEGRGALRYDGEILHNGAGPYATGTNRWALFDVEIGLDDEALASAASVRRLRLAVDAWKNARSWLRAFSWRTSLADEVPAEDFPGNLDPGQNPWAVRPEFADTRSWAFPLYNGEITYSNAVERAYDGKLAYGGGAPHSSWGQSGYRHDAQRDRLLFDCGLALRDSVSPPWREALFDARLRHDGRSPYGRMDAPAMDAARSAVGTALNDAFPLRDISDALPASPPWSEILFDAARLYDGLNHHGRAPAVDGAWAAVGTVLCDAFPLPGVTEENPARREILCNATLRYDGLTPHGGPGMDVARAAVGAVLFDAFPLRDIADEGPARTAVGAVLSDTFPLRDIPDKGPALRAVRNVRHNGGPAHNGALTFNGKEVLLDELR